MPARRVALLLQTLPRHDACLPAHTRRWHWSDPAPTHVRIPSPPRWRPPLSEPAATFSTAYAPSGNGSLDAQGRAAKRFGIRSEEHTSELQSRLHLVCRLLLEKKKNHARSRTASVAVLHRT